ncbi:fasciclin-like arabinogalactan protein 2 [Oryza brachyantha]|uniref:FAS1 domain-containing protein n=1 Tax=Oryza brachyantha TaxID=4533 RepID=J3LGM9_ORYBR|nr:fasciclin-like arabinogalactan protein 2 [Oryza brachyantha]
MPRAGVVVHVLLLFVALTACAWPACRATHNITAILAEHRDLVEFNRQLTATGLADDIDGRNTITVLAVDDAHMAQLKAKGLPRDALRHVLSLHVLVDYYDDAKLHRLPGGSTVVSTLFQASGDAPGSEGMVKIVVRRGGRVAFVPQDVDDARANVFYVKSVHEAPYNISVLQVSAVITSPAAEAPSAPESKPNTTDPMSKHGSHAGASTAPSPAGQGSSEADTAKGKQAGDGGDRGNKNGASSGAAQCGLPFALAFLMAAFLVVNW